MHLKYWRLYLMTQIKFDQIPIDSYQAPNMHLHIHDLKEFSKKIAPTLQIMTFYLEETVS